MQILTHPPTHSPYVSHPTKFRRLYGSYNFGQMIETSHLSVSALHAFDEADGKERSESALPAAALVGFAVLSDSPRHGVSEDWLEWFAETHAPTGAEVTMTNTLWVEFAVAIGVEATTGTVGEEKGNHNEDAARVLESIVRSIFNTLPEVDYLVMSLPGSDGNAKGNNIEPPSFLLRAFEVLTRQADAPPKRLDDEFSKHKLLLCDRAAFLPTLAVRYLVRGLTAGSQAPFPGSTSPLNRA